MEVWCLSIQLVISVWFAV